MNILAIDTSGPVASCALMSCGRIVHSVCMQHGLTHSETILPAVDSVLVASGVTCQDIDVFAAVAGPGSFTGVRIGVCMAKGFARAVNKPCCPINSLEALSMNFAGFNGLVAPILDARRGQVYCAAFDMISGMPVRVMPDAAMPITEFLEALPRDRRVAFLGDGLLVHAQTIIDTMGEAAFIAPANLGYLRADSACVLAETGEWIKPALLRPIYLRAPQAERERKERSKL